jgi:hypothetical protein
MPYDNQVHVLFVKASNPYGGIEIDTTSNSGKYRDLSPFVLGPIEVEDYLEGKQVSKNFENYWQFSKVYFPQHVDFNGNPTNEWFKWRDNGFNTSRAIRYPMGRGTKPLYSYWNGYHLKYIEARKKIYASIYAKYVVKTKSFDLLYELYSKGETLILKDYDAYDHMKERLTLKQVINDPNRKCGHAFVLAMILQNKLEECLQ